MKHPRRWAALLAAFLIAASLTLVPREGAAWPPYIDGDPSPPNEGEPDVPPTAPYMVSPLRSLFSGRVLIARAGPIPIILFVPKENHRTDTRLGWGRRP